MLSPVLLQDQATEAIMGGACTQQDQALKCPSFTRPDVPADENCLYKPTIWYRPRSSTTTGRPGCTMTERTTMLSDTRTITRVLSSEFGAQGKVSYPGMDTASASGLRRSTSVRTTTSGCSRANSSMRESCRVGVRTLTFQVRRLMVPDGRAGLGDLPEGQGWSSEFPCPEIWQGPWTETDLVLDLWDKQELEEVARDWPGVA